MSMQVESAKRQLMLALEQQPEDSSFDELLRELAFVRMVSRGLMDSETGRVVSNEQMRREIDSWRTHK